MTEQHHNLSIKPDVKAFFDPITNTISYVVSDPASQACAVVDSVMDIDYAAGRITHDHADGIVDHIEANDLTLAWIIETHVHADHLSAAPYLQKKLGGKIGISAKIMEVQDTFGKIFNEGTEFQRDGSQFDALFNPLCLWGTVVSVVMQLRGHSDVPMSPKKLVIIAVMNGSKLSVSSSIVKPETSIKMFNSVN